MASVHVILLLLLEVVTRDQELDHGGKHGFPSGEQHTEQVN
jgi:hypothetical protein